MSGKHSISQLSLIIDDYAQQLKALDVLSDYFYDDKIKE